MPFSSNAEEPSSSFFEGNPKTMIAGMFKSEIVPTSSTTSSKGSRSISGIDSTFTRVFRSS